MRRVTANPTVLVDPARSRLAPGCARAAARRPGRAHASSGTRRRSPSRGGTVRRADRARRHRQSGRHGRRRAARPRARDHRRRARARPAGARHLPRSAADRSGARRQRPAHAGGRGRLGADRARRGRTRAMPCWPGAPRRLDVSEWHNYACIPPAGASLLARSPACVQAFRVGATTWGLQFHVEVTRPVLEEWCEVAAGELEALGLGRSTSCSAPTSSEREQLRLAVRIARSLRAGRAGRRHPGLDLQRSPGSIAACATAADSSSRSACRRATFMRCPTRRSASPTARATASRSRAAKARAASRPLLDDRRAPRRARASRLAGLRRVHADRRRARRDGGDGARSDRRDQPLRAAQRRLGHVGHGAQPRRRRRCRGLARPGADRAGPRRRAPRGRSRRAQRADRRRRPARRVRRGAPPAASCPRTCRPRCP